MFDELKDELELAALLLVKRLIFVLANVIWFALLVFAFPDLLRWFLWPLG